MNINFGMDNFYVRYLKRFLASEMPQTNMVLGEFDKDDQQLLIQYLNLPNVEPMSRVQRELNKRYPQLKSMFSMDLQDNTITWTAKTISRETSQFISENLDEIQEYCKSVGWKLQDATEWMDELMDVNGDGVVDDKDKLIVQDIAYNNNGYEVPKGRIQGKLIDKNITDWSALKPTITLYNSYNQVVSQSNLELIGHTYLFRDLEQGTYHITISADGFLDITMNNIYVKTGFLSHVQDINLLSGDVNGDKFIDEKDQEEIKLYIGQPVTDDTLKYDLNRDGVIDNTDVSISLSNKGKVPANLYWVENLEEMDTKNKYSAEVRERADITKDGVVDGEDLARITNYLISGKPYIRIIMENRENHFPNEDMKVFVNQFDGTFLYDYAIKDGLGYDGFPHKNASGMYKIALYKCEPNQKITIAHNNINNTRLVIGSSPVRLKQDVTGSMLQNVVDITLNAGESYEYQASGSDTGTYNAHWVCIQCPSSHGDLLGTSAKSITGEIGDINFDGKIDMEDYKLAAYYTAEGSSMATDLHWEATPRQILAMDVDKDGKVTNKDAVAIHDFINGTFPGISLGLYEYTYNVPSDYKDLDNVSNLLIIDGWYEKDIGIPFLEFTTNPWIVHEKFFNYLLGMAVHKYSNSESITFVQEFLKEYYPFSHYGTRFFDVGVYNEDMKIMMKEYQRGKTEYTYGDLDFDGKLTDNDLEILREYLYGLNDLELETPITLQELRDYLDGKITLPHEKQIWADVDRDGVIDEKDYLLLTAYKGDMTLANKVRLYLDKQGTLTPDELEVADRDGDGEVTEEDYITLSKYPRVLAGTQRSRAYITHTDKIDVNCYYVLEANINGASDSLRTYLVPFSLGWYDMDTEYYMEQEFNSYETISEVSK